MVHSFYRLFELLGASIKETIFSSPSTSIKLNQPQNLFQRSDLIKLHKRVVDFFKMAGRSGVHHVLLRCKNLNVSTEFKIPKPEALHGQMLNKTYDWKLSDNTLCG